MKNSPIILSSLSLLGVIVLLIMHFSKPKQKTVIDNLPVSVASNAGCKIAYVNIDSLETHYEYLKTKREEFKRRQSQMESELQRSYQQIQSDYEQIQKKAQSNSLTQSEYETAQQRLNQMSQSLETRKQSLTEQLMKEQDDFNKDLKMRLDSMLTVFNTDKHYDYILSFSGSGPVLYANKQLDITKEVVEGLNGSARGK